MDSFKNSFALLIGIEDPKKELPSIKDAQAINDVLIDKKYAGYPKENVYLLNKKDATRKRILEVFNELQEKTDVDSKIFFYYSGHGAIDKRKFPASYYLEVEGFDINNPEETGVKGDELKSMFNKLLAERLILIFDCCHAQGMTEGQDMIDIGTKQETFLHNTSKSTLKNPEGLVHDIDNEEGMAILSSCKDHEESLYFRGDPYSLFTMHLLKVLKGEHKTSLENPLIKVLDVASYLIEAVPEDAATVLNKEKNIPYKQTPFVNLQIDKNFELSRIPEAKFKKSSLDQSNAKEKVTSKPKKEVKKVFRQNENSNSAIIFVHGFSGEAHNSFGKIPEFLMQESQLDGWDMYPFGFNSNVNPEMGKEVWATIKDINRISDNLSSAINYKFKKYERIAIVAYSLGGLVAQQTILNLSTENRDRIKHVLLFGTPSNGITNNAIKNLWKNKINELVQDKPYITNLRSNWTKTFNGKYPFDFKVVSGSKDEYANRETSLDPFDKSHWITVSGDHFSMMNVQSQESDSYHLILNTLSNKLFLQKFSNQQEINLALGEYDAVIRELLPKANNLDETHLEHLVDALECRGRSDEAEAILTSHPSAMEDADMLQVLGDLYKRKYLDNSELSEGMKALNCYTKALKLAEKDKQTEQICKNAIDLRFLNLMIHKDYDDNDNLAQKAIDAANKFRFEKIWKLRTLAEGHLYLNELETATDYYKQAAQKASLTDKIEIYSNAYSVRKMLFDIEDPNDEFLKFLKEQYLT